MLQFTTNRDLDPDGASLRKLLEAHVIYERMSGAKKFCLHLLAIVGLVVWVGAMWPAVLPSQVLEPVLALWGGLLFFAILASAGEWLWHREVERYRRERQASQKEGAR
jgi:membrane protein implicated in regulation of membrane protease activity